MISSLSRVLLLACSFLCFGTVPAQYTNTASYEGPSITTASPYAYQSATGTTPEYYSTTYTSSDTYYDSTSYSSYSEYSYTALSTSYSQFYTTPPVSTPSATPSLDEDPSASTKLPVAGPAVATKAWCKFSLPSSPATYTDRYHRRDDSRKMGPRRWWH